MIEKHIVIEESSNPLKHRLIVSPKKITMKFGKVDDESERKDLEEFFLKIARYFETYRYIMRGSFTFSPDKPSSALHMHTNNTNPEKESVVFYFEHKRRVFKNERRNRNRPEAEALNQGRRITDIPTKAGEKRTPQERQGSKEAREASTDRRTEAEVLAPTPGEESSGDDSSFQVH